MINLTDEQSAIIEAVPQIERIMKINAFAGTGKTSTLVGIANTYPGMNFLYLAFNKAISDEAKRKFPVNVKVYTTHALAKRYVAPSARPRGDYRVIEIANMLSLQYEHALHVDSMLRRWTNGSYRTFEELAKESKGEAHLVRQYVELTRRIYTMMKTGEIDMTHSFYLKEFQLNPPKTFKLDYIMVDEAQDTNDVTLDIVNNLPGRKIIVGDTHQQIYAFRGSVDAMQKIKADKEFYLTKTFRCRPYITSVANQILATYKKEKRQLVPVFNNIEKPKNKAYLSRTNAELIGIINKLDNFNLTREPKEIFKSSLSVHYFVTGQFDKIEAEYKFLKNLGNEDALIEYIEAVQDSELKKAYENHIAYGPKLIQLFAKAVACKRDGSSNVTLSTAHSSKGLEWDITYLTPDFPDLNYLQKSMKERKINAIEFATEVNLQYVAATRAIYELVNLDDDYVRFL